LEEYELSRFAGEPPDAKLTHDNAALLPEYGLLVALLRPSCAREGEEDILAGGSMRIASERSIGISEEPAASRMTSGNALAMAVKRKISVGLIVDLADIR
jgi:hypothetical protein